ncbi:hypothetical protein A3N50_11965 [Klebsiella aerogenes]|nr:hypothetical protein A3N50_11965 [Klebsiella aerogenes]
MTPLTDPLQCEETPDLVLECASQQAVAQYGEAVLARGWHLAVISTGALADSELEQRLRQAGGKLTLLAGAFQHQIRRLFALQRIGKRRHRVAELLADRRMMRFAGDDPTQRHLRRQAFNHRLRHRAIAD